MPPDRFNDILYGIFNKREAMFILKDNPAPGFLILKTFRRRLGYGDPGINLAGLLSMRVPVMMDIRSKRHSVYLPIGAAHTLFYTMVYL